MLFVRSDRRLARDWRIAARFSGSEDFLPPISARLSDCLCLDDLDKLEPGFSGPG